MKTLENKALDLVNAGIGIVKKGQEEGAKVAAQVQKTLGEWGQAAEKTFEDLKVRGALDKSNEAQKARELAVNAARKLA